MSGVNVGSVQRFAELCAVLDHGFAARSAVLLVAGLDDAGWERLRSHWVAVISANSETATVARFIAAYGGARRALARGTSALAVVGASSLGPEAELDDVDITLVGAASVTGPALPFLPANGAPSRAVLDAPSLDVRRSSSSRAGDPLDATAALPLTAIASPVLPFAPPDPSPTVVDDRKPTSSRR